MASIVLSHWHQRFDDMQLSSMDFYEEVYQQLLARKLPGVALFRAFYAETGMLSTKREYFRIQRNEYYFDLCAAPFGKDFFISYWLSEVPGCLVALISYIPFIGKPWARWLLKKTFYQQDTEIMFKESVQALVREVVNKVHDTGRGLRRLEEGDMTPQFDTIKLLGI